jgi:DNA modification methylase
MIIHGDSLDELKKLEANSIDAVVTDPPYGLGNTSPKNVTECLRAWSEGETWTPSGRGFMNKSWDAWVPPPELWREVFRVLKHGGHALVFAGSRTQDLMSISLRLAGFEVRDTLQWLYGSGFPKSHNVSKAIDKWGGAPHLVLEIAQALKVARESRGVTVAEADRLFCDGTTMYSWFEGRPRGYRMPNDQTFTRIVAEWPELAPLADKVREAEREVIGRGTSGIGGRNGVSVGGESTSFDLTTSATEQAKQWEGWGTALKPAYEPVILVRKPLQGTVAQNVLEHGTGALNIDATRIGEVTSTPSPIRGVGVVTTHDQGAWKTITRGSKEGRWPANVLLDQESADLLEEQAPKVSRFFYCAKASKAEREAGLEYREAETRDDGRQTTIDNPYLLGDTERRNTHPTVKPIDLMRYLCRLITPPNGTILDPFTGSGSTLCAATLEGFKFVGIEREAEYVEIARARVAHYQATLETEEAESQEDDQLGLFDNLPTGSPRTDGEG